MLPRALAEHVMAQLEDPANLDRWNDPARRLVTLILIRCGLRLGDALRQPPDCIVPSMTPTRPPTCATRTTRWSGRRSSPSTRSFRPRSPPSGTASSAYWPQGAPVLFPSGDAPTPTAAGGPANSGYQHALGNWLLRCDVSDERGKPVHRQPPPPPAPRWERA